jgi:hypothetical protein
MTKLQLGRSCGSGAPPPGSKKSGEPLASFWNSTKCFYSVDRDQFISTLKGRDWLFQVLLPHSEIVFRWMTPRGDKGPDFMPNNTPMQYQPMQTRSQDTKDPTEAQNSLQRCNIMIHYETSKQPNEILCNAQKQGKYRHD